MADLTEGMSEKDRKEWQAFVKHFREEALKKMDESAYVMQIVPTDPEIDVNFAVQLGASILLDKPILAVVMPGARIPAKLRVVADEIVEADVDTDDGRRHVAAAIQRFHARLPVVS